MNRRLLAALALAAALAGCSPASEPVARVGDAAITAEDFSAAAKQNGSQYAQFGDSAKFVFMDDLVKRLLLVEGAKAAGLYRDSSFLAFAEQARDRAGRDAILRAMQGGTIEVSEAEARALYDRLHLESHVRAIVLSSKGEADAARRRLDDGEAFETVAAIFNTSGLTPPGGDAGWLAPGVLPPVLDRILDVVPVGEVVGPLESPGQGWFLMRVDGRREVTPAAYEEMRGPIVDRIRQRKTRATFIRAIERLKAEHDVRLADGAVATMNTALRGALEAGLGRLQPDALARLGPEVRAGALGLYRGGVYTVADAIADLERGATAPNLAMMPQVERWIESQALERAILAEARARHAHEEPETRRAIRNQEEGWLLDAFYTREVMSHVAVSPEAMQAEYALRQRELTRLDAVQVVWVAFADSNAAMAVAATASSGAVHSLAEAVAQAVPGTPVRSEVIRFPNQDFFWMGQMRNLMMMREGAVAGPFPAEDGYRFVQLLAKSQYTPRWDELDPQVLQQLQSLTIERQRETRFAELTDSLRKAIPVTVDRAKVEKLEWPLEAMFPPNMGMGMPMGG